MPNGEHADARRGPSLWTEVLLASEASYFRASPRHRQPLRFNMLAKPNHDHELKNRCRRVLFKSSKAADQGLNIEFT